MEKKYIMTLFALGIVGLLAISLVAAESLGNGLKLFKPAQEDREAMQQAVQNNDYATWKALMEQRIEFMKSQITEENFNQMVEFHQNMNQTGMQNQGMHQGKGMGMKGQNKGNCPYA